MTVLSGRPNQSRRAALAQARQSRRPSRLGTPAGTASKPDQVLASDAGFPGLLQQAWERAAAAPDLPSALQTLLTLDGHVPADVQLRALRMEDECAIKVLFGHSWRADGQLRDPAQEAGRRPAFRGELGLTTSGRVVLRVPSQGPLSGGTDLVGGVIRVPWPDRAVSGYLSERDQAIGYQSRAVADCRRWLAEAGRIGRDDLLDHLKEAALRTAPFTLYQEDKQYTNFRDRNTLTGKTLWPGHPDCALSSLQGLPLQLWSDQDVVLVVCLALLIRSAGFARIEEANGTQLSIDHVAHLLELTRQKYNAVPGGREVPPAGSHRVAALADLSEALRERRRQLGTQVLLYREIHGALVHKVERIAGPRQEPARGREATLCAHLREHLPVTGATLDEIGADIAATPSWLARPHAEFGTGLESLVYQTVSGATAAFESDFAMSRGIRSLPRLIAALGAQDWSEITKWEVPEFFCCVVPAASASRLLGDSAARLADIAWAISSRMQYNSWHFIAGNLPKDPMVVARDYFVPPTIPDLAYFSDLHHRGHVSARVRFSIRSPQPVEVAGRIFHGFVDLRLLRCEGRPFDEQDLLAAHRGSQFIAQATGLAADLAAGGADLEVSSFDSEWHWSTIAATEAGTLR